MLYSTAPPIVKKKIVKVSRPDPLASLLPLHSTSNLRLADSSAPTMLLKNCAVAFRLLFLVLIRFFAAQCRLFWKHQLVFQAR
jgi:hypothetical protein